MRVVLRGITKRFGAVRALSGVDATFEAGRVSVVSGANGSGKSTLLAIIGTLARPTSGAVDHDDLGANVHEVRSRLGWVGHETLAYGDLTGRENIELAADLHGLDAAAVVDGATARFGLSDFLDRHVRTYSRGQRQRVALARALVHEPSLLLLDEPTAGLDAASTEKLVRVVREEANAGAIVVLITHDPGLIDEVADEVWLLVRGRLARHEPATADEGRDGS